MGRGQSDSGRRGWTGTAAMGDRIRFAIRWCGGHDRSSPFGGRGQYSVIANQMVFRTRDEGCEFFQQILGRQDDVSGSVAPRQFLPVGFIDDDERKVGKRIHGYPVFARKTLPELVKKHQIEELVISSVKIADHTLEDLRSLGIGLKRMRIRIE